MSRFINPGAIGPTGPQGPAGNASATDTYDKLYVTNNGNGTNVKIGDDAWIGDVNTSNHVSLIGVQDPTIGGIILGNAETSYITGNDADLNIHALANVNISADGAPGWVNLSAYEGAYVNGTTPGNKIVTFDDLSTIDGTEISYTVGAGTAGTPPTFNGAPLFYGSYTKQGNLTHFRVNVDFDNITSFGTGQYYITLPVASTHDIYMRNGHLSHNGTRYSISGHVAAGTDVLNLFYTASNGREEPFSYANPVILTTADDFHLSGSYFAA